MWEVTWKGDEKRDDFWADTLDLASLCVYGVSTSSASHEILGVNKRTLYKYFTRSFFVSYGVTGNTGVVAGVFRFA